jgi:integrase
MPNLDVDFIAAREPDVVINLMAERHLIRVPDDLGGPTIADVVAGKRSAGRVRPKVAHWDSRIEVTSPATVERMRQGLLSEARARDAAMISVLAYGALKPEELVALRWRDVAEDRLTVRKPGRPAPALWTRFPALGRLGRRWRQRWNVDRIVPMMDHLAEDLMRWRSLNRSEPGDLVFPAADGAHWKRGEWRAWRDGVYVPLARACDHPSESPYDLRHTFALLLINAGVSARKLAALLGSTRERVLMDYGFHLVFLEHAPRISADAQIARVRTRTEASRADGDDPVDAFHEASQRP